MEEQLKRIQEIKKMLDEGISKKEFSNAFNAVIKQVTELEKKTLEKVNKILLEIQDTSKSLKSSTTNDVEKKKQEITAIVSKAVKEIENLNNFVHDKVSKLKSGVDGKDGKDGIGKDGIDGKDGSSDTPEETRDKLESIDVEDEKLKIESVGHLREELDELKSRPLGRVGGGTSDLGVQASLGRLVKTETVSGTIDGANKAFTTTSTIYAVLSYMLNGEVVAASNYTISGSTITWGTAPPATYSGKDHQIIYV